MNLICLITSLVMIGILLHAVQLRVKESDVSEESDKAKSKHSLRSFRILVKFAENHDLLQEVEGESEGGSG